MSSTRVFAAVLFDMDGTLVDSNGVVESMWERFAQTHGFDVDEVLRFSHGTPSIATLTNFLDDERDIAEWFERISGWEREHFDEVAEVHGAAAFVASLERAPWAVVTSALADAAERRLGVVGLPSPRVLIGADQVSRGKPDPEGFLAAAARLGVDPAACLVVEDSPAGIEAGLAAGATVAVMGASDHPVTEGLSRFHDWTAMTARVTAEGIEITADW